MKLGLRLAGVAGLLLGVWGAQPAVAQADKAADENLIYWQSDNWLVVARKSEFPQFNSCELTRKGLGANSLRFFKGGSEVGYLQFRKPDEQADGRSNYDVRWIFDEREFKGSVVVQGLYSGRTEQPELVESFKKANQLVIEHGGEKIAHISLAGSFRAHTKLVECAAQWPQSFVPVAPAPPPRLGPPTAPPVPSLEQPATPRNDPARWVASYDQAGPRWKSGAVGFRLEINEQGGVKSCSITSSSGHSDLDNLTCQMVSRRARFRPATDTMGNPTQGSYAQTVRWAAPDNSDRAESEAAIP